MRPSVALLAVAGAAWMLAASMAVRTGDAAGSGQEAERRRQSIARIKAEESRVRGELEAIERELARLGGEVRRREARAAAVAAEEARLSAEHAGLSRDQDAAGARLAELAGVLWPLYLSGLSSRLSDLSNWAEADRRFVWLSSLAGEVRDGRAALRREASRLAANLAAQDAARAELSREREHIGRDRDNLSRLRQEALGRVRDLSRQRLGQEAELRDILAAVSRLGDIQAGGGGQALGAGEPPDGAGPAATSGPPASVEPALSVGPSGQSGHSGQAGATGQAGQGSAAGQAAGQATGQAAGQAGHSGHSGQGGEAGQAAGQAGQVGAAAAVGPSSSSIWPAEGARVVEPFDPGADPPRRGIGLSVPEGAGVRAAAGGQVAHADVLRGLGRVVILDHGGQYYTIYAHLSETSVAPGDTVSRGASLGRAGYYPPAEGPGLYFELRFREKAINPGKWLAARN